MTLFEDCKSLTASIMVPAENEFDKEAAIFGENINTHITVPEFIKNGIVISGRTVFYISDLHLVHHIIKKYPDGATDEEIMDYIHSIILELFTGDFADKVNHFESPIVLFGGDISSSFSVAKLFYSDFVWTWDKIVDDKYKLFCEELDPIKDELYQLRDQFSEWEKKNRRISIKKKPITEYSDKIVPKKIKSLYARIEELREQYRSKYRTLGCFYNWKKDYVNSSKNRCIYSILGNHELWDFDSYSRCVRAYEEFFKEIRIHFLCDDYGWLGKQNFKFLLDSTVDSKNNQKIELQIDNNDKQFFRDNILIVGGMGFSGLNNSFNADQGIYRNAVSRREEKKRSKSWNDLFRNVYSISQVTHSSLLVFTHMPISDWGGNLDNISNCIFINGHTHRNIAYGDENNNFVFADNQIGYNKSSFTFKKAILHVPRNPFAIDPDGYREITCDEYIEYYRYVQEKIPGTGIIERQISSSKAKLFVMKQDAYVAFFLVSPKGVYICNGGQIKKVGSYESLNRYYLNFMTMIDKYIVGLTPFRIAQEKLASFIKSFGGSGRIHGTIVDIDYYNHIMLNTYDGSITIYNSPIFGYVKPYPNIGALLHKHCPELEENYKKIGNKQMELVVSEFKNTNNEYVKVDIKNSPYAISRRMNALQTLFTKRILRDWNTTMENVTELLALPEKE